MVRPSNLERRLFVFVGEYAVALRCATTTATHFYARRVDCFYVRREVRSLSREDPVARQDLVSSQLGSHGSCGAWLAFGVCCLLFAVWCLLFAVCRLVFAVFAVCCSCGLLFGAARPLGGGPRPLPRRVPRARDRRVACCFPPHACPVFDRTGVPVGAAGVQHVRVLCVAACCLLQSRPRAAARRTGRTTRPWPSSS